MLAASFTCRRQRNSFGLLRLAALLLLSALAACTPKPALYSQEAYVFGTRVEALVYGENEDTARAAVGEVLREFDRLHRTYHAWQPSELTALNAAIARGDKAIPVSDELAAMVRESAELAAKSDQLFNPALGRLIALWGFHNDEFKPVLPDALALKSLIQAAPSMLDLSVNGAPGSFTVTSRNRAAALDFGGYAKGYALDRAAVILRGRGVRNALINIGGNILALGSKGKDAWRVGIQHPRRPEPLATLELHDGEAIGTSGDYQRFFELNGRRYCHILDPRTGYPAEGAEGVTVLIPPGAKAGMLSDAVSKPLFIAGSDRWQDYARRLGVTAFLRVDSDGTVRLSPALAERLTLVDKTTRVVVASRN